MKKLLICLIMILFVIPQTLAIDDNSTITIFHSKTCPVCKEEIAFLNMLESQHDDITINYLEASEHQKELLELSYKHDVKLGSVPLTHIDDRVYIGFSHEDGELEFHPVYKAYVGYKNVMLEQLSGIVGREITVDIPIANEKNSNMGVLLLLGLYLASYILFRKKMKHRPQMKKLWIAGLLLVILITLFMFMSGLSEGAIKAFAEGLPFPAFVAILAFADGFNPCAFTVLIILLSLLTYTKRKQDSLVIGSVFVITSAVMYFIFIMVMVAAGSWAFSKYGHIISLILGGAILIAGLINLKDFFFFGKGVSLTISHKHKIKITQKARDIVNLLKDPTERNFLFATAGTVVLGIFVNLIELGCSAILPAVYMSSLVKTFGESLAIGHILWTLYYSVIYIIPLLILMLIFIYSFKSTRMTEKQGRILKLVSGLIMIAFGLIMLFKPELLVF